MCVWIVFCSSTRSVCRRLSPGQQGSEKKLSRACISGEIQGKTSIHAPCRGCGGQLRSMGQRAQNAEHKRRRWAAGHKGGSNEWKYDPVSRVRFRTRSYSEVSENCEISVTYRHAAALGLEVNGRCECDVVQISPPLSLFVSRPNNKTNDVRLFSCDLPSIGQIMFNPLPPHCRRCKYQVFESLRAKLRDWACRLLLMRPQFTSR